MPNHGTYFFFILRIRRPPKSPLFPYATLSRSLGYRLIALPGVYCHALLAAERGEAETTRRLADDLTTWAAPRGARVFDHFRPEEHTAELQSRQYLVCRLLLEKKILKILTTLTL